MTKTKIVLDDLTDDEAWALAQMCKRMIWDDFRRLSAGPSELEDMDSATIRLRRVLAEAGFDAADIVLLGFVSKHVAVNDLALRGRNFVPHDNQPCRHVV